MASTLYKLFPSTSSPLKGEMNEWGGNKEAR